MKVPVEWLSERVDLSDVTEDELARALTMAGLEVEDIQGDPGERVLVTKVTPNRGDWMSIIGVAREAAAALERDFRPVGAAADDTAVDVASMASIEVVDKTLCPRYGLRIIRDVKNRPSPLFMQRRLTEAGMRPLGVLVDITNYVMIELGQPLHAFDYDKIPDGKIVVRLVAAGEVIQTLDGADRPLPAGTLVIADRSHPIAVAGIMGGSESEVSETTATILLESAHFDAGVVRRGAKALGMTTEASYRFERYVDPGIVTLALDRAAGLLEKYADGHVVPGILDSNPNAATTSTIDVRPDRVNAILGETLSTGAILSSLKRLGLNEAWSDAPDSSNSSSAKSITITVPSFRPDLRREIDLIEEVGRMIGYETLPETLPPARGDGGGDLEKSVFDAKLRALMIGEGLYEAFTHTLTAESAFDDPAIASKRVRVRQALSSELTGMRQSLLPNLLEVMSLNVRHRQPRAFIFEIGNVFQTDGPGLYSEYRRVAGVMTGGDIAYAAAKGVVENVFAALHLRNIRYRPAVRYAIHPGRCAEILLGGEAVGFVGEADPDRIHSKLDVPSSIGRVALFELDVDALRAAVDALTIRYEPQPRFPSLVRDLAMVFDRAVPYGEIEAGACAAGGELLSSVTLLSVYTGERVAADKKSVAIRLVLRSPDRTLTDADADAVLSAVQPALVAIGGEAR